jgi:hypothetical protein
MWRKQFCLITKSDWGASILRQSDGTGGGVRKHLNFFKTPD